MPMLLISTRGIRRHGAMMMAIRFEGSSATVPLLNYTTKIPVEQTAAEIMSVLVKKGATDILTGPEAWPPA